MKQFVVELERRVYSVLLVEVEDDDATGSEEIVRRTVEDANVGDVTPIAVDGRYEGTGIWEVGAPCAMASPSPTSIPGRQWCRRHLSGAPEGALRCQEVERLEELAGVARLPA